MLAAVVSVGNPILIVDVLFQIPQDLQYGLDIGVYERIGGIIREVDSKRIIAWLREGSTQTDTNPLHALGASAQTLSRLYGTGLLINLAITGASLLVIKSRLDGLASELDQLSKEQKAEFDQDRLSRFVAALNAARDALEAENSHVRQQRAYQAIEGLYHVRSGLVQSFERALEKKQVHVAHQYLTRAMYATTSLARCNLELEEWKLARRVLGEHSAEYEAHTRALISAWLGDRPSLFLYKDVKSEDVYRFISVFEWLKNKPIRDILVEDLRGDFWNDEVIREDHVGDFFLRLRGGVPVPLSEKIARVPDILMHVEALIENLNRLHGFELEVRSARLLGQSFEKWHSSYVDDSFSVLMPETPIELTDT